MFLIWRCFAARQGEYTPLYIVGVSFIGNVLLPIYRRINKAIYIVEGLLSGNVDKTRHKDRYYIINTTYN